MALANIPQGQLWIEVFLCPGELAAAQTRARSAAIDTIVADIASSRVVLMVRTPARRDDDADTKLEHLQQAERLIRGTLSAVGFSKALKNAQFESSHQKLAPSAKTRPGTDARIFELAVLSLGSQIHEAYLDLLRLYLVPVSVLQERRGLPARDGNWTKNMLWQNWQRGDAGFLKYYRDMFDPPAPPEVWQRT